MEHITQEVRNAILSTIPHENHRKLASMLMDGVSSDEIKTHGFDQLQIDEYSELILSFRSSEATEEGQAQTTQPEDTTTPEESTPETVTEEETTAEVENTEPEASDEATEPVPEDEIPA